MSLRSFLSNARSRFQGAIGNIGRALNTNQGSFSASARNARPNISRPGLTSTGTSATGRSPMSSPIGAPNTFSGNRTQQGLSAINSALTGGGRPNTTQGIIGPMRPTMGPQQFIGPRQQDRPSSTLNGGGVSRLQTQSFYGQTLPHSPGSGYKPFNIQKDTDSTTPIDTQKQYNNQLAQTKALEQNLAGTVNQQFATQPDFSTPQGFLDAKINNLEQGGGEIDALQQQLDTLQAQMNEPLQSQEQFDRLVAEEQKVKDELNKSLMAISGQAIPYSFITGQGARIQNLAQNDLERIAGQQKTLQEQLAQEQMARQRALDFAQQRYEYARGDRKENRDRMYEIYRDEANRQQEDRTFNENVRQFGLEYALKARQENRLASQNSNDSLSKDEFTRAIYQQIGSPDFEKLSRQQKRSYLLSQGANPSDFGF